MLLSEYPNALMIHTATEIFGLKSVEEKDSFFLLAMKSAWCYNRIVESPFHTPPMKLSPVDCFIPPNVS
jgi:hypothetical protein